MGAAPTLLSLSPRRRQLVELMRLVEFGRVERLRVAKGEPDFGTPPRVIRTVKVGIDPSSGADPRRGRRPRADRENYYLQPAVTDLLDRLARMGDGVVELVEVAHGQPLFFEVAELASVLPQPR